RESRSTFHNPCSMGPIVWSISTPTSSTMAAGPRCGIPIRSASKARRSRSRCPLGSSLPGSITIAVGWSWRGRGLAENGTTVVPGYMRRTNEERTWFVVRGSWCVVRGGNHVPRTSFLARHRPDRVDQVAQVIRLRHRRLAAVLQKRPRFAARLIARHEHEPLRDERPAVDDLLIHGAAAEAWHLEIRHDRVERVVPVAQALHGRESI